MPDKNQTNKKYQNISVKPEIIAEQKKPYAPKNEQKPYVPKEKSKTYEEKEEKDPEDKRSN